MFGQRVRDPFGSQGVSCVKLPAAVAFPTDDRLLRRIEESRRALPANNMKPLRKSLEPDSARPPTPAAASRADLEPPAQRRWVLAEPIRIEDVYARSRLAGRQR